MKKMNLLFIPIAISIIGTLLIYPQVPAQVPVHWNIHGEIDRWQPKYFVFITALLPAIMVVLLQVLPSIDPRTDNYRKHRKAYGITAFFTILFLLGIHWTTLLYTLGYLIRIDLVIRILIGIIMITIGNYLPQAKPNYTFGIRLPWTLADETVWKKTHRLGGFLFACSGIIGLLTVVLSITIPAFQSSWAFWILVSAVMGSIIWIAVYSYREFRKTGKQD